MANRSTKPTPKQLFTSLKYKHGWPRLMLAEHAGDLWVTNSYWLMRSTPEWATLLAAYNLPLEPMVCDVGDTLHRLTNVDPPKIAAIIDGLATARTPIEPFAINGMPILIGSTSGPSDVYKAHAGLIALNGKYLALIDKLHPFGTWTAFDEKAPLAKTEENGRLVALLMPIHSQLAGIAAADVEAAAA